MTNISNDINLLRINEDSVLDNTTNKRHRLIKTPVAINIIQVRSSDSLNLPPRSHNKSKTESKKKILTRYIRSRSKPTIHPVISHEHEQYHPHPHHRQQQQIQPIDGCDMRLFII